MVIGCPLKLVTPAVADALEAARWADHGKTPCDGGFLDQTQWTLDAIDYVRATKAEVRREIEK